LVDQTALERPPSLTDAVVGHIQDAIISGRYVPGQQLTEAKLAQALGTSRGTVREAMRVLANFGLVSLSTRRGASVTRLTPERARETYTLRALLESYAARVAAEEGRIDGSAVAALEERYDVLVRAAHADDVGAMVEADMQFHQTLSALSGHRLLLEHLGTIQAHSKRLLLFTDMYRTDAAQVARRHVLILDAIRGGDAELLERTVRDHIVDVGKDTVTWMADSPTFAVRSAEELGSAQ
jgi:DNA-binding GntR family transcriptional regulator